MALPCGYDEEFVESTADYLKCGICCQVLKDPVQIMRCGHRYCATCFQQIKSYSQHLNSRLICPVDREEIDVSKVFDDTGMTRIIGDLKVKCSFNREGCEWSGELRSLDAHRARCTHNVKPASPVAVNAGCEHTDLRLTEINNRMDKLEDILYEKEKDIAYMKLTLQQRKGEEDAKNDEMKALKAKNLEMREEIVMLKESNKVLQENLSKIEGKCENHHSQLDKLVDTDRCDTEMVNLKTDVLGITEELNQIKICNSSDNSKNSTKYMDGELRTLKETLKKLENDSRSRHGGNAKSLNELKSELSELQSRTDGKLSDLKKELLEELDETLSDIKQELFEELDILHTQQLQVNQVNEETQFTWKITEFEHRFNAREMFTSPKFYCAPHGHICQLVFTSVPERDDDMIILIRLCKGRNIPDSNLFLFDVTWEFLCNDGSTKKRTLKITDAIRQNRFTFQGPHDEFTRGHGGFFPKARWTDYVKDDCCTITCSLKPSN